MTKQLYEEALADVKKVKQVAEDNAKRAVLEAVTPRIREFIDQALLKEYMDDESAPAEPGAPAPDGDLLTDLTASDPSAAVPMDNAGAAVAVSPPDADGKITLDIDALCSAEAGTPVPPPMFGQPVPQPEEAEYEINMESIGALEPVLNAAKKPSIDNNIAQISEQISLFKKAGKAVRNTPGYREQIAQMISRVENMYDYVQEQVADPAKKDSYETMLEASFKALNKLQESTTMSQKSKQALMNEEDVTLKLTGLPDDIDLDTVGVDLITGEDEEGGDLEGGDQADFGGDDLDLGGQDMGGQEMGDQMETRKLSDDTIVEIDEKMLRREIARMRGLREAHTGTGGDETKAQSWGNGPDHFDSFGGGKDEGEPTDAEIVDKSPSPGALPLGEADEDLEEMQAAMEESELAEGDDEELDEAVDGPAHGGNQTMPTNKQSRHVGESASARLSFEKKLQERAKSRAAALKKEAANSSGRKLAAIKQEYATVAKRFNESLARSKKLSQMVESAKLQGARSNSGAQTTAEVDSLRKKLAETNLFNAKLLYTNKLLQNESLTTRQKAQVIKQLDSAKTVREAKLVYESLSSTLAGTSKPVNESTDRAVIGSGSRTTRPASTQTLNEGYEAERWAKLAGITKR